MSGGNRGSAVEGYDDAADPFHERPRYTKIEDGGRIGALLTEISSLQGGHVSQGCAYRAQAGLGFDLGILSISDTGGTHLWQGLVIVMIAGDETITKDVERISEMSCGSSLGTIH